MLFAADRFEQFFNQKALDTGFQLFRNNAVALQKKKDAYTYAFTVKKHKLLVKKRGGEILFWSCSCKKRNYCEHFAAAMFLLQEKQLHHILPKGKKATKGKKTREADLFKPLNIELNTLYNAYFKKKWLSDKETIEGAGLAKTFLAQKRQKEQRVLAHLSLLKILIRLLQKRVGSEEDALRQVYLFTLLGLEQAFKKGLLTHEKRAWFETTLYSVSSNRHLQTGAYEFLLPRLLVVTRNPIELDELENALADRKLKIPYTETLDRLLIAKKQVGYKTGKYSLNSLNHASVEAIIALAELLFCEQKNEKAFNLLESCYAQVLQTQAAQYRDYLLYLLEKARRLKKTSVEINYLKESFIYRPFISEADLERFFTISGKKRAVRLAMEIVEKLKTSSQFYSFDKISALLLKAGKYNELVDEIKRQENQFGLLNKVLLLELPNFDKSLFKFYASQFTKAMQVARSRQQQQTLFNLAKQYISNLPRGAGVQLVEDLVENQHLRSEIYELFANEYPFLVEKEIANLQEERSLR